MKRNKKIKIFLSIILLTVVSFLFFSNLALAQFGLERFEQDSFLVTDRSAGEIVMQIIRYVIGIIGIVFLVLIIYGGVLYATSAGNKEQVDRAKRTFKFSIIGIVIVALSFAISTFVTRALFTEEELAVNVSDGGSSGTEGDKDLSKADEMIVEGNDLLREGQERLDRGSELRRQAAEASGAERERLLEEAEEIEDEGLDLIDDGHRLINEGEAILESGGDGTESLDRSADRSGAADVDVDCGREGDRCGWFASECCGGYECDEGRCTAGDPGCHEGEEGCSNWGGTIFGDPCCEGLACSEDTWVPGGGECDISE